MDRVPIPPVPMSDRARREEIECHHRLLPDDLYYDPRYAPDSALWDTWFQDEHDTRRASFLVGTSSRPRRPRERRARAPSPPHVRGRTRVRGLTPTPSSSPSMLPSPSSSPPPPPRMTEEEEARLLQRVMEDSMNTHDERQWEGLETMIALSAAGDVAVPKLEMREDVTEEVLEEQPVAAFHSGLVGQGWSWSCRAAYVANAVGAVNWCPTPPQSPERETSPRGEVVQAPPAFQGPAHLWTPPPYINLTGDDDDNGDA